MKSKGKQEGHKPVLLCRIEGINAQRNVQRKGEIIIMQKDIQIDKRVQKYGLLWVKAKEYQQF